MRAEDRLDAIHKQGDEIGVDARVVAHLAHQGGQQGGAVGRIAAEARIVEQRLHIGGIADGARRRLAAVEDDVARHEGIVPVKRDGEAGHLHARVDAAEQDGKVGGLASVARSQRVGIAGHQFQGEHLGPCQVGRRRRVKTGTVRGPPGPCLRLGNRHRILVRDGSELDAHEGVRKRREHIARITHEDVGGAPWRGPDVQVAEFPLAGPGHDPRDDGLQERGHPIHNDDVLPAEHPRDAGAFRFRGRHQTHAAVRGAQAVGLVGQGVVRFEVVDPEGGVRP